MIELKNRLLKLKLVRENEYLDKYIDLILSNKDKVKEKFKTQRHHIVPRSYFKINNLPIDDSKENMVNLLYKDHILAHYYLCNCALPPYVYSNQNAMLHLLKASKLDLKDFDDINLEIYQNIYENWKKQQSLNELGKPKNISEENKKLLLKHRAETYANMSEERKLEIHENRSKAMRGENNPMYSKKRSDISALNHISKKGNKYRLGKKCTEEQKAHMRGRISPSKDKLWVTNGVNEYMIFDYELNQYIEEGFYKGRSPLKSQGGIKNKGKFTGDDNVSRRPDVRLKISQALKGHKHSEETKVKLSKARKGKYKGYHYFTDGEAEVLSKDCPEGFVPGRRCTYNKKYGVEKTEEK